MLNPFLDERTRRDIDLKITKVLRDLGDPEPPLRLEIVHELLKLDLAYSLPTTKESCEKPSIGSRRLENRFFCARPSSSTPFASSTSKLFGFPIVNAS